MYKYIHTHTIFTYSVYIGIFIYVQIQERVAKRSTENVQGRSQKSSNVFRNHPSKQILRNWIFDSFVVLPTFEVHLLNTLPYHFPAYHLTLTIHIFWICLDFNGRKIHANFQRLPGQCLQALAWKAALQMPCGEVIVSVCFSDYLRYASGEIPCPKGCFRDLSWSIYVLGQVWHCLHCCSGLSVQLFRVQSTLAAKKNQVVQPGATFTINFVNYTMMVLTLIQDQLWRPVCKVSRKMFISLTGVVMPALAQFRWLAWHATSMD